MRYKIYTSYASAGTLNDMVDRALEGEMYISLWNQGYGEVGDDIILTNAAGRKFKKLAEGVYEDNTRYPGQPDWIIYENSPMYNLDITCRELRRDCIHQYSLSKRFINCAFLKYITDLHKDI